MSRAGIGLMDKLYRRPIRGGLSSYWHCFAKNPRNGTFNSLCGMFQKKRSDGQQIRRPRAMLRCASCDVLEMKRRGWDESGPATTQQEGMW